MSNNENQQHNTSATAQVEASSVEKLQDFFEQNKNTVLAVVAAIVILCAALFYYKAEYMPKAENEANSIMFDAQYYFEQDSFDLALNAPGGFLEIIDEHSGTKAAKLSNYYAGLCYYNLGDFASAVDYLKSFKTSDDILGGLSLGVLADAQLENGNVDAALSSYKKAANYTNNEAIAPFLIKKAAVAFEMNNDKAFANQMYKRIKKEFPNSDMAKGIDIYIARTEN